MRGKAGQAMLELQKARITPAYAGKRLSDEGKKLITRDHPRLCGEK